MTQKVSSKKTQLKKQIVIEALEKSLGIVTTACLSADISRRQFYRWLEADPEFKQAVNDIENVALDFVESSLHKQIQAGVPASTIFYLKTKGRNRGYIERHEITGKDSGPIEVKWDHRQ